MTIRADIEKLVERRLRELGETSVYEASRKHGGVFTEPLCTYINPLCPDDLCYLPYGHAGCNTGWHVTGTTPYSNAIRWGFKEMAPLGTTREELIELGWARAEDLL
jgi:hypothetical protein